MAQKLNKETGELKTINIQGLWSHFPIPAYKILARRKQWQSQRLLNCLVSYMGGHNGLEVFPSYEEIYNRCGLHPGQIKKNLDNLEELGFIKVYQFFNGKHRQNKYYLQPALWESGKMNLLAKMYLVETHKCVRCGKGMDRGGYGTDSRGSRIHFGCGGPVVARETVERVKIASQMSEPFEGKSETDSVPVG